MRNHHVGIEQRGNQIKRLGRSRVSLAVEIAVWRWIDPLDYTLREGVMNQAFGTAYSTASVSWSVPAFRPGHTLSFSRT